MPDDAHSLFRLRKSLTFDLHKRNSRVGSHYWYHLSSFLILNNFSRLLFSVLNLSGFSKNFRNWAYVCCSHQKGGCWWQKSLNMPTTSQKCYQYISSPTFVTNMIGARCFSSFWNSIIYSFERTIVILMYELKILKGISLVETINIWQKRKSMNIVSFHSIRL